MAATKERTVTVFGGTGFLGRRVVRHLRNHGFPYGLHRGIRVEGASFLLFMTLNFNRSRPTFTMNDRSPMPLLALTAW